MDTTTTTEPTPPVDAGPPPVLALRGGAARVFHVGYGSSDNPRVLMRVVLSTSPDLCAAVPATHDDTTVTFEILMAEDVLRPQQLAHAPDGVSPGSFRGWVHRVASDCHIETSAHGRPSVAFDAGATLEIVATDETESSLRVHFASRAGTFDGTVTTRACTSPYAHLDPFEEDDAVPGCALR